MNLNDYYANTIYNSGFDTGHAAGYRQAKRDLDPNYTAPKPIIVIDTSPLSKFFSSYGLKS